MEPVTVYKLISNVMYPKNENDWKNYQDYLWTVLDSNYNLQNEVYHLVEYETDATWNDFKNLIPIHPYTAYLSARIVQWFGSSQRTLFRFLKEKSPSSFVEFLQKYPKDNWYLLTPDFLWDYYFASNEEIATFHPEVLSIINYWNSQKDKLDEKQIKVFKVVMLLSALTKKIEAEKYLRPLLKTLKLAFSGTPLYKELEDILRQLVNKGILREDKLATDKEYWIPSHDISPDIIKEIREKLEKTLDFSKFINQYEREFEDLKPHRRAVVKVVSSEDVLKGKIPKISIEPYQLGMVLILLKTLERVEDLKKKVQELSQQYENMVFVISLQELGETNWESVLSNMTYEIALKQTKKEHEAEKYRKEINETVKSWINNIRKSRFIVIHKSNVYENVFEEYGLRDVFKDIVKSVYPYGLDEIILSDPLWRFEYSREGLRIAIEQFKAKARKGRFSDIYEQFVLKDKILDEYGNFTGKFKDHPLCKMKEIVTEMFESGSVSLKELWNKLQSPPFGLYPSPLGSFVFGILMKDYCKSYYYTDGTTENEINPTKMVEILYDVIKNRKDWILRELSREQKKFCELVKEIFKLSDKDVESPNKALISLRTVVKDRYHYPLWILKYSIISDKTLFDYERQILLNLIDKLNQIVKALPIDEKLTETIVSKNTEHLIKEFVDECDKLPRMVKELTKIIEKSRFDNSFEIFVSKYIDRDVNIQHIDDELRKRLQEEPWAWDENKVAEILNDMRSEIELAKVISSLFDFTAIFLKDVCLMIKNKIKNLEILPLWMYSYHPNANKDVMEILSEIEKIVHTKQPFKTDTNKLIEKIEQNRDLLIGIMKDFEASIKAWIINRLDKELNDTEYSAVLDKIKEHVSKTDGKADESQLLRVIKEVLKNLRINILRNEICERLKKIFGTDDMIHFYKHNFVPIALIKYLPEMERFESNDISIDEFFRDLTRLNDLSEKKLEKYIDILNKNEQILSNLNTDDIWIKLFKNFFGNKWISGVFTDDDLKDLKDFLTNSLGRNVECWDERQIRKKFEEWKKEKYGKIFYYRLQQILNGLSEKEVKDLLLKLMEDADIGLRMLDLLKTVRS